MSEEADRRGDPLSFAFRCALGAGAAGLAIGAIVLIAEGVRRFAMASIGLFRHGEESVVGTIMKATDECLFGILLAIIAANVIFGFVLDSARAAARGVPAFMRANSLHELKATFCQVIIVYLIVDFATDMAQADKFDLRLLGYPAAITLIAAAVWISSASHGAAHAARGHGS